MSNVKSINESGYNNRNQTILLIILTLSFTLVSMLAALQPILVNVVVNVLLPFLILIFCNLVFFERLKLSTLTLLRIAIVFAVFNVIDRQFYVKLVLIFLVLNILEATFTDIFRYKRYFNGVTGIVLAGSVFFLKGSWLDYTSLTQLGFFSKYMHSYEFHASSVIGTICWIIAYTIWNWFFVTNEFSSSVARLHVGILAAPILGSLIMGSPNFWLAFRADSLAFGGCFQISEKDYVEARLYSKSFERFVNGTKKNGPQAIFMLLNIVLLAIACFLKTTS